VNTTDIPPGLIAGLGAVVGVLFAAAILVSHLAASWLASENAVIDALVRLAVFGAITIGLATVVGAYLAPAIRANASWFWLAFFLGFAGTPFVFRLLTQRRG